MRVKYDYQKIDALIDKVLQEIGPERFKIEGIQALEQRVRASEQTLPLPAKSQLRAAIHSFRKKRWPETAPRRRIRST
jgi:hypothetical protein